jgi:hypothetical protein
MFESEPASQVARAAQCFRTVRRPLPFGTIRGAEADPDNAMALFGRIRAWNCSGVYRLTRDLGTLTLLVEDFVIPNGLAFSPDEKILYINDARRRLIRAFDLNPNGTVEPQRHARPAERPRVRRIGWP